MAFDGEIEGGWDVASTLELGGFADVDEDPVGGGGGGVGEDLGVVSGCGRRGGVGGRTSS